MLFSTAHLILPIDWWELAIFSVKMMLTRLNFVVQAFNLQSHLL